VGHLPRFYASHIIEAIQITIIQPKMPPKRQKSLEQEGRILLAISSIQKKEISNIREAARLYNVPRTTLQRQLNGDIFRIEQRANNYKLKQNKEESLVQWILSMDRRGAAPRPAYV